MSEPTAPVIIPEVLCNLGQTDEVYYLTDAHKTQLWEYMYGLAKDHIEIHAGDLYHDAKVLNDSGLESGTTFMWAPYECGTHFQWGEDIISMMRCPLSFDHFYVVTIQKMRYNFLAQFKKYTL